MAELYLDNDIKFLRGVGDYRGGLLNSELGIGTMRDLLYYFPFRYIDRSQIYKIAEIADDSMTYVQLRVRIEGISIQGEGRRKRLIAYVADSSGVAELIWFSGIKWFEKSLKPGEEYIVFGRPSFYRDELSLVHPELEGVGEANVATTLGVQGVYSTTERLTSAQLGTRGLFNLVRTLWETAQNGITETLPQSLRDEYELMPLREALFNVHFPENDALLRQATYRLKFEELFGLQLNIVGKRSEREKRNDGLIFDQVGEKFNKFYQSHIPFELTDAQKRVIREIRVDTKSGTQMNRLLQGDVGSGKTLVALMSMMLAIDNGFQTCMMAPTEILARQHFATISSMVGELARVEVLTGSSTAKERREIDQGLRSGEIDILIGTHALIEDKVVFDNMGFVVIDEQHRFGVEQRARLWAKGQQPPHILVMTATPIPRTLAMTLYGDLDVSVIDQLPPGRKPIKTILAKDSQRLRMFGFIREQIAAGRQIYLVYPLIKESEKMDYKNLHEGYESLIKEFPPPRYVATVVHGKMKAAQKEENMQLFKSGKAHILVATTVIEVGVDVPNASVMVIESAERFGLSQLHQLRGRVGRGSDQAYCLLMSGDKLSNDAKARLEAMVETNDGFVLSELDLKLRGAGSIAGTQQSGLALELKISNLSRDGQIVEVTRDAVLKLNAEGVELSELDAKLLDDLKKRFWRDETDDFSNIS